MALSTLSDVKVYLGETTSDNNTLIAALLAEAESVVTAHLGCNIEAQDYTETINGNGFDMLPVRQSPVNSVSSVKISSTGDFANTSAVASTNLTYESCGIVRLRVSTFERGVKNVQVAYNAGYATVPKAIVEAVHMIVADRFQRARQLAGGQGPQEMTDEQYSDSKTRSEKEGTPDGIPEPAKGLLSRYRKKH